MKTDGDVKSGGCTQNFHHIDVLQADPPQPSASTSSARVDSTGREHMDEVADQSRSAREGWFKIDTVDKTESDSGFLSMLGIGAGGQLST